MNTFILNKFVLILILIYFIPVRSFSYTKATHHRYYVAIVKLKNNRNKSGLLLDITDTTMILCHSKNERYQFGKKDTLFFDQIFGFKIRKANAVANGVLAGIGADVLITTLAISGSHEAIEQIGYYALGLILSPVYIIIGAAIGTSTNNKYEIYGEREIFKSLSGYLKTFTIVGQLHFSEP